MRSKSLQIISWWHITLILAILLPCLYAGDTVAREPGWCLHLKGLLLIIPVSLSDIAIRHCKNLFLYTILCVAILFVMLGAVQGLDMLLQTVGSGAAQAGDITPQKIVLGAEAALIMIGRFTGRADLSDVEIEESEQALHKPVSKSIINEPAPEAVFYFGIVYLVGMILKNSSLCNEALFSGMIYIFPALWYCFIKTMERYLAINRRVANLPGKRMYGIGSCVMAMFLLGLTCAMIPAIFTISIRNDRMQVSTEVRHSSEVIRNDSWEYSNLTEGAKAMWASLGAPEDGLPEWLNYIALVVFIGSVILLLWLVYLFIRKAFLSFQESYDENGDQLEKLQENNDFISFLRNGSKEPERNDDVRKRYRKIIRKHRKERPGVYESPAEIEAAAGLAGEPEMQELHVLYEKVRYGR